MYPVSDRTDPEPGRRSGVGGVARHQGRGADRRIRLPQRARRCRADRRRTVCWPQRSPISSCSSRVPVVPLSTIPPPPQANCGRDARAGQLDAESRRGCAGGGRPPGSTAHVARREPHRSRGRGVAPRRAGPVEPGDRRRPCTSRRRRRVTTSSAMYAKLGVRNRTQATSRGDRSGSGAVPHRCDAQRLGVDRLLPLRDNDFRRAERAAQRAGPHSASVRRQRRGPVGCHGVEADAPCGRRASGRPFRRQHQSYRRSHERQRITTARSGRRADRRRRRHLPRRLAATPRRPVADRATGGAPRDRRWQRFGKDDADGGPRRAAKAQRWRRPVRRRRARGCRGARHRLRPAGRHHPSGDAVAPDVALRGAAPAARRDLAGRGGPGGGADHGGSRSGRSRRGAGPSAVRRAAQAGEHRCRAADPAAAVLSRRTDLGTRSLHRDRGHALAAAPQ